MYTYSTLSDFKKVKEIKLQDLGGERVIQDYLKRATSYIEGVTRRRFVPWYQLRRYAIPTLYVDLANRTMLTGDLDLKVDMLELLKTQIGSMNVVTDTTETLASAMTARQTTITMTDIDGADELGNTPRIQAGDVLRIDNENMLVLDADTTTTVATVERGTFATLAAAHASGATINKMALQDLAPGIELLPLEFNIYPYWGLRVVFPKTWAGSFGALSSYYRYPSIYITGLFGYHTTPPQAWVDTLESLQTSMTATDTTFTAVIGGQFSSGFARGFDSGWDSEAGSDAVGEPRFEVGYLLRFDNEITEVLDFDEATRVVTLLRGQNGTRAVAHEAGTVVYRWSVHYEIREVCFTVAKTWREADIAKGGRQGVSEVSTGVELSIPADAAKILARYVRGLV